MNYLLDVLIVAICIIPIIIFAKKGFVYALLRVVGFLAALVIATNVGSFFANYLCENVVAEKFVSSVKTEIDNGVDNVVDSAFEALPDFIKENSEGFGVTKETISDSLSGEVVKEEQISELFDITIKPIIYKILSTAITLISFLILLFVVGFLSRFLNKLFSFSVVGTLNRTLGGLLGLPIGVIFSIVFCFLIELTLSLTSKGLWIFDYDAVNSSKLYNLFMSIFN